MPKKFLPTRKKRGFSPKKFLLLIREWKDVLGLFGTSTAAIVAGAWLLIEFFYPKYIEPHITAPRLELTVNEKLVGVSKDYKSYSVTFSIKNDGINTVYVPSVYYLANAYKVSKVLPEDAGGDAQAAAKRAALQVALAKAFKNLKLSKEQIEQLRWDSRDYLLRVKWMDHQRDDPTDAVDIRSIYDFDRSKIFMVQCGSVVGSKSYLDPGEEEQATVLLFVPPDFQALEIESTASFTTSEKAAKSRRTLGIRTRAGNLKVFSMSESELKHMVDAIDGKGNSGNSLSVSQPSNPMGLSYTGSPLQRPFQVGETETSGFAGATIFETVTRRQFLLNK